VLCACLWVVIYSTGVQMCTKLVFDKVQAPGSGPCFKPGTGCWSGYSIVLVSLLNSLPPPKLLTRRVLVCSLFASVLVALYVLCLRSCLSLHLFSSSSLTNILLLTSLTSYPTHLTTCSQRPMSLAAEAQKLVIDSDRD
jgi:hypothetical protein